MYSWYTASSDMPKHFTAKIGARDIEILTALDRTPLTPAQLCRLSQTFTAPFQNEDNLRRRLRALAGSGLIRSWSYAIATDGRSPRYFKLTRDGYRLLYGTNAALPRRRYFEEISHGHHYHTFALAECVVQIAVTGHQKGIMLQHFARENSVKLEADGFAQYPDCAFQLATTDNRVFHFVVELDNGTERVRTKQDVESIERKLRGYDAHQSRYGANDANRYLILFITTRSQKRLQHILDLAALVMRNPQRTVFLGCSLQSLKANDPFTDAILQDHRRLKRMLVPRNAASLESQNSVGDSRYAMVAA